MEEQPLMPIRLENEENGENQNNSVIIQVKENLNKLLLEVPEIVEKENNAEISIYRIPHFMREQNPAFEPKLVSLGPYHYGKPHLQPMELEKHKAFHSFKTKHVLDVESIVESVSNILKDLLGSYDEVEEDKGKFLRLMIIDGCFVLEFFMDCPTSLRNMSADIKRDMLLLENQLPMKLLEELYSLAPQNQEPYQDLTKLICESMSMDGDDIIMKQCYHILDMYKFSLIHPMFDQKDRTVESKNNDETESDSQIIQPATRLEEAGIRFVKSETKSFTDVSFKRGVLSIPHLTIDDDTESAMLNVMAFEKLHLGAGSIVTSFMILMNNLIDGERDVSLLAKENILAIALGNDEDAAKLFNRLGSGAAMDLDSDMVKIHVMINRHYNQPWNEWCASLKHEYFQGPWAFISLCAAILGFLLLILQFVYQILDYYLK